MTVGVKDGNILGLLLGADVSATVDADVGDDVVLG